MVEGNPLQSMNEVSTCGKLDRSTSDFVCSKPPLFVSCAVSPGLQSFFFFSEVFSKAFDREFWANGSSKQKLSTALVWTVTYATCVSFFGQSVGQRMLDMLQLGMRKTWLCAVQARWTRRGLRDRKVKVAELL